MCLWPRPFECYDSKVSKHETLLKLSIHSELVLFIGRKGRHAAGAHDCSLQILSEGERGKALDGELGCVLL